MMSFKAQQKAKHTKETTEQKGRHHSGPTFPCVLLWLLLCEVKCFDSVVSRPFQGYISLI